ncbi:unnamed protein product [Protopolystoma xenopodis]|uniref:Ig-like domain-containing protein n=1 Tax=Protopolystoma xenopodis TaxID=117903 RepID=A0A448W9Z3_9PLAT|nr:unnamed protein product [Protopolystoma xenopodis]
MEPRLMQQYPRAEPDSSIAQVFLSSSPLTLSWSGALPSSLQSGNSLGPDHQPSSFSFSPSSSSSPSSLASPSSSSSSSSSSFPSSSYSSLQPSSLDAPISLPAGETTVRGLYSSGRHIFGDLEAYLECWFAANPRPQIQWYLDDVKLPLSVEGVLSPSEGQDPERLYITVTRLMMNLRKLSNLDLMWEYGGEYRAVASNSYGSAECRTMVLMDTPLRMRPVTNMPPAIVGRAYTLKCYFIGSGIPKVSPALGIYYRRFAYYLWTYESDPDILSFLLELTKELESCFCAMQYQLIILSLILNNWVITNWILYQNASSNLAFGTLSVCLQILNFTLNTKM